MWTKLHTPILLNMVAASWNAWDFLHCVSKRINFVEKEAPSQLGACLGLSTGRVLSQYSTSQFVSICFTAATFQPFQFLACTPLPFSTTKTKNTLVDRNFWEQVLNFKGGTFCGDSFKLLIVLDQFPRNVRRRYPGSMQSNAMATDSRKCLVAMYCRWGILMGAD